MQTFDPMVESILRSMGLTPEQEARARGALARRLEQDKQLEPFGLTEWQAKNRRTDEARRPYVLTEAEFFDVVLPAISHIKALPTGAPARRLFAFAGDDWRAASDAVDVLHAYCDARLVRDFVRSVCLHYSVLKQAERAHLPEVFAFWDTRHCEACRRAHDEPTSMETAPLLEQFARDRYSLAHETHNDDGDLVHLCAGPMLALKFL